MRPALISSAIATLLGVSAVFATRSFRSRDTFALRPSQSQELSVISEDGVLAFSLGSEKDDASYGWTGFQYGPPGIIEYSVEKRLLGFGGFSLWSGGDAYVPFDPLLALHQQPVMPQWPANIFAIPKRYVVPPETISAPGIRYTFHRLVIPYWFVVTAFGLWLGIRLLPAGKRRWRLSHGLCIACGYDLRHSKDKCPECGMIAHK